MKKNKITYFHSKLKDIEIIYCEDSNITYPKHNHISCYTIGIVLEGSFELQRKNKHLICVAGDIFIIPPYEPHAISHKEAEYTILVVCIKKESINEQDTKIILFLKELFKVLVKREIISEAQVLMLLDKIEYFIENIASPNLSHGLEIDMAKNILEKEPENDLQIEQLSRQIFISKYHLIRKFREQVGLTPHRFQMQNRIRKAQRILTDGGTITEVALVSGFYDQSHFNKWFKKIVGLTPSEYQQACDSLLDNRGN